MTILLLVYFVCAAILMLYGLNCHVLTRLYRRHHVANRVADEAALRRFYGGDFRRVNPEDFAARLPVVTTQLPVFNERNVVERLIDAVAAFRYPAGRHHIQVLDDSTDETRQVVAEKVARLRRRGVDIVHVVRSHRTGFKAGALRAGLKAARGDFAAVFDADFLPPRDFLMQAMPFFSLHRNIGFVQGRWTHLNREESLITRLQAMGINGHFMIEQAARSGAGLFLNFNGTAGVFRKTAILAAGNWQDDTLTEDMDLSYRIQLAGWRCRFLGGLTAPAEIPRNIHAFKNQQFRWAKGSIQTARKLLTRILRSPAPPFVKYQSVMHLTHYLVHPLMLFLAVTALPVLVSGPLALPPFAYLLFGMALAVSCSGPSLLYYTAERALGVPRWRILALLPVMICFGCGIAVNNTRAVMEALVGKRSEFVRTPKMGFRVAKFYGCASGHRFVIEVLIGLWCLAGAWVYFHSSYYLVGHFLMIYTIGFSYVGLLSWWHGKAA